MQRCGEKWVYCFSFFSLLHKSIPNTYLIASKFQFLFVVTFFQFSKKILEYGFSFFSLLLHVVLFSLFSQTLFQFLFVVTITITSASNISSTCFSFFSLLRKKMLFTGFCRFVLVSFRCYNYRTEKIEIGDKFQFLFVVTPNYTIIPKVYKFQFLFVVTLIYIELEITTPPVLVSFRCYISNQLTPTYNPMFQFLFVVTCEITVRPSENDSFSFFSLLRKGNGCKKTNNLVLVSFRCYYQT